MQLIRIGFDGFDISYKLTISQDLADKLEEQRKVAEAGEGYLGLLQHNGVTLIVQATGAKGGYAFRCDTGRGSPFGENWFFKRPNGNADEWGVRVSCRALPLAMFGLSKVRQDIEATLSALGMTYEEGMESIGRVDVACDILAPDFAPDRDNFIAHAQSKISEISTDLMQVVGRSGRVETITIGRNPQRQVVLYDKRAEVIATGKLFWWPIWDASLAAQGLPSMDRKDRAQSSVWRVEVRAYKRHLKDKWGVTTWGDLREKLPEILHYALCDVRYTEPTADTNRARWPDHPLWDIAREAFSRDFADLQSMVDRATIDDMLRARSDDQLCAQITSGLLSRTALFNMKDPIIHEFARITLEKILAEWTRNPQRMKEKLAQARVRYGAMTD